MISRNKSFASYEQANEDIPWRSPSAPSSLVTELTTCRSGKSTTPLDNSSAECAKWSVPPKEMRGSSARSTSTKASTSGTATQASAAQLKCRKEVEVRKRIRNNQCERKKEPVDVASYKMPYFKRWGSASCPAWHHLLLTLKYHGALKQKRPLYGGASAKFKMITLITFEMDEHHHHLFTVLIWTNHSLLSSLTCVRISVQLQTVILVHFMQGSSSMCVLSHGWMSNWVSCLLALVDGRGRSHSVFAKSRQAITGTLTQLQMTTLT